MAETATLVRSGAHDLARLENVVGQDLEHLLVEPGKAEPLNAAASEKLCSKCYRDIFMLTHLRNHDFICRMTYREKTMKLSSVCEVQVGYTARSKLEPTTQGGVPAIQLRDLQGEDDFDPSDAPLYALGPSFERYWAGAGDVLFRSRGARNTAVPIAATARGAAIAILPLLVLRPDPKLIESKYLAWLINQPTSQRYFDKCAQGTRLRMLPKSCLDDLEVPLPELSTQRLIVELDLLARRECALSRQLAEKKLELTHFVLLRQARNAQPHGNGAGRSAVRPSGRQVGTDKHVR
jgi:hypothetical protein